ncbi:MAG: efflux RND transporter periplasmic adaptor subunit [Vicinamibacterales bacterium]
MRTSAFLVLPLFAALASAACGGPSEPVVARDAALEPRPVSVTTAALQPLERAVSVTGTLAAEEQVALAFKVTGRVQALYVDLGSRVRRGAVLARLTPTDFELRLQQAEAALQQARARLGLPAQGEETSVDPEQTALVRQSRAVRDEARLTRDRMKTFVDRGISSRADLDAAEAALEVADGRYQDAIEEIRNREAVLAGRRSELELARQALEDTVLRAPIDGAVRERHVTQGEFRSAGTPVLTIVSTDPLRLRVAVPERAAAGLRAGQPVRVRVEGDAASYDGKLVRLGAAIDEDNRTLPVEATVSNRGGALRPGMFAAADIIVERNDTAIVVPNDAVVTFAGVQKVLVVREGTAREQRVRTGRRSGDRVEILEGVTAGEVVILHPGDVVDGLLVRPASEPRRAVTGSRPADRGTVR